MGTRPNTDFVRSLGPDVLDERGFIRVKPTLQVAQFPEIFAAGDAIDWDEQKQAAKASGHTPVVVANLLSYVAGKPLQKRYKGSPEMIAVTDGKVNKF